MKQTIIPATKIPKQLEDLIFDNKYWLSKGCIPIGILKMQELFRRKYADMEEICITALKDIVFNRPEKKSKVFYFFSYKRNPITCKFYEAISCAQSLRNLVASKKFKEILEDRTTFNDKLAYPKISFLC